MSKTIGRYEIREELGRGGMAAVYRAYDPQLSREVALKLMEQRLSADPAFAARFEREAKTVASLEHTAIVPLHDYGDADGWLYLVMRYMKGGSLREQIARGPLKPQSAYNIVHRIGGALDKAHGMGVIHRDLKPGNILLDEEGESYLSDFGIVKVAKGEEEFLTETGQTLGTFAYMSPEQVLGNELDGRSDIYALGIVLYEMLTGTHPYSKTATTSGAMAIAHTQQPVPDVTEDNPNLPPAMIPVIQKALAKEPADRYASGAAMAEAMQAALEGADATVANLTTAAGATVSAAAAAEGQAVAPEPIGEQPPRRQSAAAEPAEDEKRGTPGWVVPAAVVAIIVVIGTVAGYIVFGNRPPDVGPEQTRLAEQQAFAANQTQVAAVETRLAEQAQEEETRLAAELTQEAESTQQAALDLTQEAASTSEAGLTRMAATATKEAEVVEQAEQTRIAAESTRIAEAAPVIISFRQGALPDSGYAGVSDTVLSETDDDLNFGDATACLVDGDDPAGSDNDLVTLLRWDISEIPVGSQATAASITLFIVNESSETFQLFELKQPWVEDEATWEDSSSNDAWQVPGASGVRDRGPIWISVLESLELGRKEIELDDEALAVIQDWINVPRINHGFIIANDDAVDGVDFICSESTDATGRPMLTITYVPGAS